MLSPFNLISWNQKTGYRPSEFERRLKYENDTIMQTIDNVHLMGGRREKDSHKKRDYSSILDQRHKPTPPRTI